MYVWQTSGAVAQLTFIELTGDSAGEVKTVCAGSDEPVAGREIFSDEKEVEQHRKKSPIVLRYVLVRFIMISFERLVKNSFQSNVSVFFSPRRHVLSKPGRAPLRSG